MTLVRYFPLISLALLLVGTVPGAATVWRVNPNGSGDAPNMRSAVDSAASGDTISLGNGLYHSGSNRDIDFGGKALLFQSVSGDPDSCIIDCLGLGRAFLVPHVSSQGSGIRGITIRNGFSRTGGGAVCLEGVSETNGAMEFTIENCRFLDNRAEANGGAVLAGWNFDLAIENSLFRNNEVTLGFYSTVAGGAVNVKGGGSFGNFTMNHCVVDSNSSEGPGGGISITDTHVSIESCSVTSNVSGLDSTLGWPAGAGILIRGTHDDSPHNMLVNISNSTFAGNIGTPFFPYDAGDGGGIGIRGHNWLHRITLHVQDCEFLDNFALQGAGLYAGRFLNALVERCRFSGNVARTDGGATYKGGALQANIGEFARYEHCIFRDNRAGYGLNGAITPGEAGGGAFATRLWPRGEFINCTFSNNVAGGTTSHGDAIMH